MLKDDAFTFYCFWIIIECIHMITPISIAITFLRFVPINDFSVPKCLEHVALFETLFYFAFYLPRRYTLDKLEPAATSRTKEERGELFHRCLGTVPDLEQWFSIWFKKIDPALLRRGDIKLLLAWGFLNKSQVVGEDEEELAEYIAIIEKKIKRKFSPGRTGITPCRVSIDILCLQHKSLLYYMFTVSVADTICHILMSNMSFEHHRIPLSATLNVYPFRPLALLSQHVSLSTKLSYWYRPHTSRKHMPILFLHGIGVGLPIYTSFLRTLITQTDTRCDDGQVGILAIEIMPISFRITSTLPHHDVMVRHIRVILDRHGWQDFVIVAHSFGSIFVTHLLRSLRVDCHAHMHPLVLIDPVTLSIHFAEIPYNFIYRRPRTASQLLCSFAATDMGIALSIMRLFDWTQNVLWLDEISDRPITIVLAGKDTIIDTTKLRQYLAKNGIGVDSNRGLKCDSGVELDGIKSKPNSFDADIVFHKNYNHGEVFLRNEGRRNMADIVMGHCQRDSVKL